MVRKLFLSIVKDNVVAGVIVVNTIAIFSILSFPEEMAGHGVVHWSWLHWVDYLCALYFVSEATIKLSLLRPSVYLSPPSGRWWNRFDFMIAIMSLPLVIEPLLPFLSIPEGYGFVLVLRLTRLFRLFRFLRFIPNVARLTNAVPRALLTSTGIVLALVIGMVITGLGATLFFRDADPEHFGTPAVAILSMVQVMTLEGWGDMVGSVAGSYESSAAVLMVRLFFLISVVGFGVIGLSLATAVLVDEMRSDDDSDVMLELSALRKEVLLLRSEIRDMVTPAGEAMEEKDK